METLLPENTCKSCGNIFTGNFCNVCGEKVIRPQDRAFRAFLNNLLQSLTLADNRALRTIWLILKRPGFVSREFISGRRVRYLKPISLFFALNLIYFLFPVIQLFNASLKTQLRSPLSPIVKQLVARKMISEDILSANSFELIYDQKTAGLAKLIVMVFVLVATLPLTFLYRRRGLYFMDHMTFMTELVCFNLFINALMLTVLLRITPLGHYADDLVLTGIFVMTNFYFLFRSGQIFYSEHSWKLVIKSVLMLAFLELSLEIYRAILFFITLLAI